MKIMQFLVLFVAVVVTLAAAAQEEGDDADQCLAPYFQVKGADDLADSLPLKSTSADVRITGVIADVTVTQVYENQGIIPLEAVYVFPGSTRAAVYGMTMRIGERVIEAEIQEKDTAKKTYEAAKKAGKSASLLQQKRPNVFKMSVANILPGDVIKVTLRYTELLVPEDGVYEFVYSTVVGPRYVDPSEASSPDPPTWAANPYLHEKEAPPYTFGLALRLSAGMPIQEAICTTHETDITFEGPDTASLSLGSGEALGGNRDFIFRYRLSGGAIQSGLLLHRGAEENFFLLMVQPPERVTPEAIPPREYIFIVDVSGSMRGFPLGVSKDLMRDLLSGMRPVDSFNVILFAGGSSIFSGGGSVSATQENIREGMHFIDRQRGGGGTRLLPALQRALDLDRTPGVSRSMVLVTDGYISVETAAYDLIRSRLGDANFFAFGIGSSVNRYLIEGLARVGSGEPFVVTGHAEAPGAAKRFREMIEAPLLTEICVDFDGFDAYDVEPLSVPDLLAGRPILVYGKYMGEAAGTVRLDGTSGAAHYSEQFDAASVAPEEGHAALRYLWARKRIALLGDYNRLTKTEERVREITALGLHYNLLTATTSFVAVDKTPRRKTDDLLTVKQPLPLPKGVSDSAVGGGFVPTTPEPETWMMILVALGVLVLALVRRASA